MKSRFEDIVAGEGSGRSGGIVRKSVVTPLFEGCGGSHDGVGESRKTQETQPEGGWRWWRRREKRRKARRFAPTRSGEGWILWAGMLAVEHSADVSRRIFFG